MVGEFPELQGVMGGYYARAQGEDPQVADAIRDHYKPVGQGDDVPTAPVTVAVSLADKLDTLLGFFWVGEKPTGSKDPFALRRAAIGVIRIFVETGVRLQLKQILGLYDMTASGDISEEFGEFITQEEERAQQLLDFFADRLKVQQREAGVRHDLIDAVFALGGEDDLVRLLARVKALQAFVGTEDGANLLAGYKRAANLLKSSSPLVGEDRGGGRDASAAQGTLSAAEAAGPHPNPSPQGGGAPEELALEQALTTAEATAQSAIAAEDFAAAMTALATLRAPIDAFFEGVMVNDPDPEKRNYRLGLLDRFRVAVHKVADFSKIEG